MKKIIISIFLIGLIFSCSKNELINNNDSTDELIDEDNLTLKDGFVERKSETNIKAMIASENCILISSTDDESSQLFKYSLSNMANVWQAETWYKERQGVGNYNYLHNETILFRQQHHDFAINLDYGSVIYDVEREDCPDSRLTGIGYKYFTYAEITDEDTQHRKDVILVGDIREQDSPEILISPPYDTIGSNGRLGRIMNLDAFKNDLGEELLVLRYHDFEPNSSSKNLFAVYNITDESWMVENTPLEYHTLGTQTIIEDDLIYFGSNNYLSCIDIKTGELKWVTEAFTLAPYYLLAFNNDIFLKNHSGMIQRRKSETGILVWESYVGEAKQFIVVHDKLFIVGDNFTIINIETGETIISYSTPYENFQATNFFNSTSNLMGYHDDQTNISHIFLNIHKNLFHFEIED